MKTHQFQIVLPEASHKANEVGEYNASLRGGKQITGKKIQSRAIMHESSLWKAAYLSKMKCWFFVVLFCSFISDMDHSDKSKGHVAVTNIEGSGNLLMELSSRGAQDKWKSIKVLQGAERHKYLGK